MLAPTAGFEPATKWLHVNPLVSQARGLYLHHILSDVGVSVSSLYGAPDPIDQGSHGISISHHET